jgi:F0F1-type ATP synthase assembly protein I
MDEEDSEFQIYRNKENISNVEDRVARLEKDLSNHRKEFESYKEKMRDKERETKWNWIHIVAVLLAAVVGGVLTFLSSFLF